MDKRTKYKLFCLSVEYMYLAARLARQWIKERSISCFVKCGVHIFTGSSGSPVHLRTRNNCIALSVGILSGSSGSALDQRTKYKWFCLSVEYNEDCE